ncbi:MAG TPA: Rid family detoxifying hydrolase [Polyangiaceae bacterium]|nr:Rid family detoxifying hydrolase [Polyangiaceae bacterium]
MTRSVVLSASAPQPVSAYSQAIQSGSLLFLAGQIPLDPASGKVVSGTIGEETERVIENLRAVLAAAGATLDNVVKTTVYLTNMADFAEFNQAYARHFKKDPPARTTVAVAALPLGVRVEVEAIAAL